MTNVAASQRQNRDLDSGTQRQNPANLRVRFVDWYDALPETVRGRPFSMQEFEKALPKQGKYISAMLLNWVEKEAKVEQHPPLPQILGAAAVTVREPAMLF